MTNNKEELRFANAVYYLWRTIVTGFLRVLGTPSLLIVSAVLFLSALGAGTAFVLSAPRYMRGVDTMLILLTFVPCIGLYLFFMGYMRGSWKMYRNFVRVGFVNAAGEAPLLIDKARKGNSLLLKFYSKGLTDIEWHDQITALQSALNLSIAEVRPGDDHRTVIVKAVAANANLGTLIPWADYLINREDDADFVLGRSLVGDVHINIDKQPMLLIGGSTGSGKTMLVLTLLVQAARRGSRVYIFDGKGLDYYGMKQYDALIYDDYADFLCILEHIVTGMKERITRFKALEVHDIHGYRKAANDPTFSRIFVVVDECAEILDPTGRSKEEKEAIGKITACINTIARMGRAVGVHLIISTQRPDANAVPGSIKSNLDVRICGKADPTLSTIILGDGRADELIPKYSQGRFVLADGAQDIIFQGFYYERDRSVFG